MKNRFLITFLIILASCSNKSKTEKILIPKENKTLHEKKFEKNAITKDTFDNKYIKLNNPKRFEDYKVDVYSGKLADPNFKNNEFGNDK